MNGMAWYGHGKQRQVIQVILNIESYSEIHLEGLTTMNHQKHVAASPVIKSSPIPGLLRSLRTVDSKKTAQRNACGFPTLLPAAWPQHEITMNTAKHGCKTKNKVTPKTKVKPGCKHGRE